MSTFVLENRGFTTDSTSPQEKEAILDRIYVYEEGIIRYTELPVVTIFTVDMMFDKATELAKQFEKCVYLIDITEAGVPNAETRRFLNHKFKNALSNVKHVSFVSGKNFFINTTARFVMFQTDLNSFSIHKTLEEGLLRGRKELNG